MGGSTTGISLDELVDRARALAASGSRRILGIVGAPGAGKSTVSDTLAAALGDQAVIVGMDGFHLDNPELVRLGRRDRKGAPDTFDVDGYVALLARLATSGRTESSPGAPVYAPRFDRSLEVSIGSAVLVRPEVPLVITEGNYLLFDDHGWQDVARHLDESWYVDVDDELRRDRLIARRLGHGHPRDEAEAWVLGVDEPNARLVDATKHRATRVVTLDATTPLATESSHGA
ncbi:MULTISPECIES: nucleoside/nucleotide kinase family protein [unclassified Plantibacter]|uniref:nucleoside/nucleotide kinase family protein n=1 Tax=unclassified Plantibacter TaxID=2624265 RepID=UPI000B0A7363|nr:MULTISPECIES: nucleoside/nucleotide kinase family protein [unclassified Plantibacter]